MELRLSRHQSLTVSFGVFGPTAKCVKSPSWMTKAGFSEAPAAYAGAGLGVSWSANATNVKGRSSVWAAKVVKPKMPGSSTLSISTANEYLVSWSSPESATWAALS